MTLVLTSSCLNIRCHLWAPCCFTHKSNKQTTTESTATTAFRNKAEGKFYIWHYRMDNFHTQKKKSNKTFIQIAAPSFCEKRMLTHIAPNTEGLFQLCHSLSSLITGRCSILPLERNPKRPWNDDSNMHKEKKQIGRSHTTDYSQENLTYPRPLISSLSH